MFCEHGTKVGSKLHPVQESVSDVSNILRSMKKYPVGHIMDDSCTYRRYYFGLSRIENKVIDKKVLDVFLHDVMVYFVHRKWTFSKKISQNILELLTILT